MYKRNLNVMCLVFICVYIIIYRDRLVYTPSTNTSSHRDTCAQCIFLSFLLSSWNLHCENSFGNSKVLQCVETRNTQYCQITCDCLAINKVMHRCVKLQAKIARRSISTTSLCTYIHGCACLWASVPHCEHTPSGACWKSAYLPRENLFESTLSVWPGWL